MTDEDRCSEQMRKALSAQIDKAGGVEAAGLVMGVTGARVSQLRSGNGVPTVEQMRRLCNFNRDQSYWFTLALSGPHNGGEAADVATELAAKKVNVSIARVALSDGYQGGEAEDMLTLAGLVEFCREAGISPAKLFEAARKAAPAQIMTPQ